MLLCRVVVDLTCYESLARLARFCSPFTRSLRRRRELRERNGKTLLFKHAEPCLESRPPTTPLSLPHHIVRPPCCW